MATTLTARVTVVVIWLGVSHEGAQKRYSV